MFTTLLPRTYISLIHLFFNKYYFRLNENRKYISKRMYMEWFYNMYIYLMAYIIIHFCNLVLLYYYVSCRIFSYPNRLVKRGQNSGRVDDNEDTAKKRI